MRQGFAQLRDMEVRILNPCSGRHSRRWKQKQARLRSVLRPWMLNSPRSSRPGSAGSKLRYTGCAASFCCGVSSPMRRQRSRAFMRAIEIARSQQARTFELRAALSLAKLYHTMGRDHAARDLLAPSLVGFSEGPELPEVADANRLLILLGTCARVGMGG